MGITRDEVSPATQAGAEWGPANGGVTARLRGDKKTWASGETPTFQADIRNGGTAERTVAQSEVLCELELDGQTYRWAGDIGVKSSAFPPGREYDGIPITLDKWWHAAKLRVAGRSEGFASDADLALAAGKHTLRVRFFPESVGGGARNVMVETNTVEFEVLPAAATGPATRAAATGPAATQPVIAWGTAVKGLQAGVRCTSGEKTYTEGEEVGYEVVLKNVSAEPIVIQVLPGVKWRPVLKDGVISVLGRGEVTREVVVLSSVSRKIAPGETMTYESVRFGLRVPVNGKAGEHVGPDVLEVPPGKYEVGCEVALGPHTANNMRDPWRGRLDAGRLTLEVAAAEGASGSAPATSPATRAGTVLPTGRVERETAEQLVDRLLGLADYVPDPRVPAEDRRTPLLREIAGRGEEGAAVMVARLLAMPDAAEDPQGTRNAFRWQLMRDIGELGDPAIRPLQDGLGKAKTARAAAGGDGGLGRCADGGGDAGAAGAADGEG